MVEGFFGHFLPKVRPISIFFDPATTYGTREGFHSGLLVTSNDRGNYFMKMPVFKSGVISGVGMLPRWVERNGIFFLKPPLIFHFLELFQAGLEKLGDALSW